MKKSVRTFLLAFIVCSLIQCTDSSGPIEKKPPRELNTSEIALVASTDNFGLKLFREVILQNFDKNVFISPLSVSMALGMTYNGADGTTRDEMHKTLEFAGLGDKEINESYKSLIRLLGELDDKVIFQIANSIWYRSGWQFEEDFLNINKTYFSASVSDLDFDDPLAADIINKWVEDNTNGKIKDIVKAPINPLTVMFLINAIYFKGTWTYEFDKKLTKDGEFIKPDGSKVTCKMMEQESDFQYFYNDDFQAVDLPYGDGLYRMTVFLPRETKEINSIIEKFNQANWNDWMNSFSGQEGILFLPKFKLEFEISLNDVLKAMGMTTAFTDFADFTKMYKPGGLFISEVKHKTYVDVYEEGTEAAAVTSVEVGNTSVHGFVMTVNRPFIFVIRENHSETILFIGKVVEPM